MERVWDEPVFLASNYARKHLTALCACASLGWVSTIRPDGKAYEQQWHITHWGLRALEEHHQPKE